MLVPALGEQNNLRNVEKANSELAEETMNQTYLYILNVSQSRVGELKTTLSTNTKY